MVSGKKIDLNLSKKSQLDFLEDFPWKKNFQQNWPEKA